MDTFVKGTYRKRIFQGNNGFIIGLFKVEEASNDLDDFIGKTITFTGYLPPFNEVDTYLLKGNLVTHPKYGDQLEVTSFEKILPSDKDTIVEFLSSDLFKGVGKKKAEKIVSVLGEQALSIILEHPNDLILIDGIPQKLAMEIHHTLLTYEASYKTILSLTEKGFSTKDATLIYSKYKENTLFILEEDLYRPFYDLEEISFKKIDYIAQKEGIEETDFKRIKAITYYTIKALSFTSGNTYCEKEEFFSSLTKILGFPIEIDIFEQACYELERALKIVTIEERYYLKELFDDECYIAQRIRMLAHKKKEPYSLQATLESLEKENHIIYNEEQKEAIIEAICSPISIITGGPGTGKTTIIEAIVKVYQTYFHYSNQELKEKLILLAPTGRAAKRMSTKTWIGSSTIHRFLKWNKEQNTFSINEFNKSSAQFVIVDETSMVDTSLMASLLKGLSANCKILLVGDSDQLPSVGPGNLLQDMIASEEVSTIRLKHLYRQGKDSNIISFAHGIREGKFLDETLEKGEDLSFSETDEFKLLKEVCSYAMQYQKEDSFQILVPIYKTHCGIDKMNEELQQIFNPKAANKKEIFIGDVLYREGDKVIQLTNFPDLNVYNGDIGFIEMIKTGKKKEIYINFDGNHVKYTPASFSSFKSAWAISIHKAQGSEFDVVLLPMVSIYRNMLYRKLFYTGVTRAKKKLILIGEKKAIQLAISNTNAVQRKTSLEEYLKNGII